MIIILLCYSKSQRITFISFITGPASSNRGFIELMLVKEQVGISEMLVFR